MAELRRTLESSPIDEERIEALAEDLAQLQAETFRDRVKSAVEARKALTPEQLERLKTVAEAR